ncbi:hypothetical protein MMC07_001819 [Pseudocyphellaria aurata]|nr:hypothetical protein [Pseudocyphellaria aurata]
MVRLSVLENEAQLNPDEIDATDVLGRTACGHLREVIMELLPGDDPNVVDPQSSGLLKYDAAQNQVMIQGMDTANPVLLDRFSLNYNEGYETGKSVMNTCSQLELRESLAETGLHGHYQDSDKDQFDDAKEYYDDECMV